VSSNGPCICALELDESKVLGAIVLTVGTALEWLTPRPGACQNFADGRTSGAATVPIRFKNLINSCAALLLWRREP
jgi:hypothetical protein